MLAWVVMIRRHLRQTGKSLAICASFCSTFQPANLQTFQPSIFRIFFQVPYPATPLFAALTKTAGGCTQNSHSGTHQSRLQSAHMSDCLYPLSPIPYTLSPFFSHSCALFCAFLHSPKTQPFSFQAIPHSSSKNKGRVIC